MKKKRLFLLLIFVFGIQFFLRNSSFSNISYNLNKFISNVTHSSEYKIIKQDINKNQSGVGQEKAKGKDGYFTTFTTTENYN